MVKETLNGPKLAKIWNVFGLGWMYGATYDVYPSE